MVSHPLLAQEPDETYSNEQLRVALGDLNDILEDMKETPPSNMFQKATASAPILSPGSYKSLKQLKSDQQKVLKGVVSNQGAGILQKSIITLGQTGTAIFWDLETTTKYDAINVNSGNIMALAASPSGNLMACGGLACSVEVYPINEALQSDLNINRPDLNPSYNDDESFNGSIEPYLSDLTGHPNETPLNKLFSEPSTVTPREPKHLKIERDLLRADPDKALKKVQFRPKVVRSDRYLPRGSSSVTNLHASFMGHNGSVQALEFLSDMRLISGGGDSSILSWDVSAGQPSHLFKGHDDAVNDFCAIDENTFISVGADGYVLLWDNRVLRPQFSFEATNAGSLAACEMITPGTSFVTLADSGLDLFDIRSVNNIFHTQASKKAEFCSLGKSNSGHIVACGSTDGVVSIIDILRGTPSGDFRAHTSVVSTVKLVDNRLYTAGYDGILKSWEHSL